MACPVWYQLGLAPLRGAFEPLGEQVPVVGVDHLQQPVEGGYVRLGDVAVDAEDLVGPGYLPGPQVVFLRSVMSCIWAIR